MSNLPVQFLTVKDAARILRVSEKTLRRWEDRGYLTPFRTVGKHRRYTITQIKEFKNQKAKIKKQIEESKFPEFTIHVSRKTSEIKNINAPVDPVLSFPAASPSLSLSHISFARRAFIAYIWSLVLLLGGYGVFNIALNQKLNTPSEELNQIVSEVDFQQVLAATDFSDAQFNINIPAIFNSDTTFNSNAKFNSGFTLEDDTVTDLTGTGLTLANGALSVTLGTNIISAEIVDNTISEVDLLVSNTANNSQFLSFNSTTGGFTWATPTDTVGTNFFTDGGDTTYLTSTSDNFALGGSTTSAQLYFDTDPGIFYLNKSGAGQWIAFNDGTDTWGLYNYAGSPEGNITANTGTLAMDTLNGTLYVKTDDSDATSWVNLATGATSPWSETGGLVTLGTSTSNVNVGGSANLGKLAVDGDTDEVQLLIQGNGTQTSDLVVFENSSGTNLLSLSNSGGLSLGANGQDGSLTLYNELGATDYSVLFQTSGSQTQNITYTLPADDGGVSHVLTSDGSGVLSWSSVSGVGGMSSFTLSADGGSDQTITDSNTLEIAGGTNGIDTVAGATDTVTLNLDTTEIGSTTFGSGSGITWTFDAGATDPTITFASDLITVGNGLTVTGALTANGTVTIGDNGDTVAINSSDWDIDATGSITGVSFDANGSGNSITNIENADLVNDTLDWDKFIDSSSLDTDLAIAAGTGEEITLNKSYTNNTGENAFVLNLTASDTGAGTSSQYGLYIDNIASTEGADALIALNNSDADDAVGAGILFTAGGAGTDFTVGIDFSLANFTREIVLENGEAIIGQVADTITFEDDDGTDYATLTQSALTVTGDLAITGGNVTTAVTFDSTATVTGTLTANGAVIANTDVDLSLAGTENFVITSGAPGADLTVISGGTSTTDGVDALQLSFGSSNVSGNVVDITPSFAGGATDALSYYVIDIDAFSPTNAAGTDLVRGINIGNLTDPGATITSSALRIGTGWDSVLDYNGTTIINGSGQIVSTQINGTLFTAASDASSSTIIQADTLTLAGGTNGIDTTNTGDSFTINLDTTEIGTTTFGSGSGIVWTFDASAGTDTTVTFGNNTQTLTAGTITLAGNVDATNGLDITGANLTVGGAQLTVDVSNGNLTSAGDIAVNGGDITSSGDITINPTGGDVFFTNGVTLNIGGNATDVAYNAIGDSTSGATQVDSDDDLYVEGNLEVDGSIYGGGIDITTFVCPDCIDFDDMEDTLDLDAGLTLNQGTNTWIQNFTGNTGTGLTYNANSLTTGSAINITTSSNPASAGPVSVNQINATTTNATTATTLTVLDIGFTNNPGVASNTEYIVQIQNESTSNTTDNATTALLRLDNADTSSAGSTVATNGLLITNSGDIAGGIVNAINIDDTDVTTDIVLQNDETIDNNVDGTITLTAPTTSLSGDLAINGGNITSALTLDSTLTVTGTTTLNEGLSVTPASTNDITFNVDTDSLFTLDSSVANGDNIIISPNNAGTGSTFTATITTSNLTADRSINFPDAAGDVCLSSGNCAGGAGGSKWTDSGSTVYLTDTGDELVLGGTSPLSSSKFSIDGDADQIQLTIQGNATQTANLFVIENSAGTDFLAVEDLGGVLFTPSSTDDVTFTTDSDSTIVVTGLSSASGTALCLDGSNNVVTCSAGSGSSTLQSAYDADTNGSDTLITLSANDDSILFRNPASSGTDSAFTFEVENLATGLTTANFKNLFSSSSGTLNTTSASLTNYAGYFSNTSTESAGANTLTNVGLYATASGGDANYSGIFESGNFGIGDTTPASLFTVGASDAFQIDSSGNIVAIGGAAHSISNSTGALVINSATTGTLSIGSDASNETLNFGTGAAVKTVVIGSTNTTSGTTIQSGTGDITFASQDDFFFTPIDGSEIDITAGASTTIEGVLDLNIDSSVTGGFEIINEGLIVNNGATAGDDFTANLITLTANDADADVFGIQITSSATANAAAGSYEALIRLDNAENTIAAVTDGILITSSSATDQDITDGIDVSHANIVNAINVGANIILGTTANIDLTNFDVTGSSGDITTAGDIAINGGDITASGDLTLTPTGGDVFLGNAVTLNIGGNATDVAYNIIGDNNTNASASMNSDDDLYIEGFLEVDSGVNFSPDSTNDVTIATDSDSTLVISGLSAGTGNALCVDGSANVVTCTVGSGGIAGSGTAGQIAIFDGTGTLTSETSGFGWDTTNNLFTITGLATATTSTTQAISSSSNTLTSGGLVSGALTSSSATASFTGDIGSLSSSRTNATAAQTLTDTGNILDLSRTTITNNGTATTNVTGPILNITNTATQTLGTLSDSANLIAITQDADATGALLYLNTNRSSTGTALLIEQSSGGTDILQVQDNGNLTIGGDLAITGGNITTAVTADSTLTVTGTLTANGAFDSNGNVTIADTDIAFDGASTTFTTTGAFTLTPGGAVLIGDGGDTLQINSSDWDVSTTGDFTGVGGITMDGNFSQTGATTLSTGTGAITLNGAVTANTDVDLSLAGTENFVITSGAPGADLTVISGGTSTTDGVDALQLSFGVSAASGNVIDITPSYADATAGATSETYNVIDIDAFTATQNATGDTGLIRGLNIGNLTQTETAGTITASSILVGTGWDDILNYNGTTIINGTGQVVGGQITDDSLDFAQFQDTLDIDAATDINLGASQLSIDLDSTGDFVIRDVTTAMVTFNENNLGQVVLADGVLLDLGAILHDDTTIQGLKLPQNTTLTNPASGEGYLAWDTDNDILYAYNGTSWQNVGGASTTLQEAYNNDVDGSDALITLNTTDGSVIVKPVAGTNFQVAQVTSAPTVDMVAITNSGLGTTTNGVDGISLTFVTGDGTDPTNNGINLALTSGGTAATDILNGINFGLTGTSATERGINFSDNNFDTDINATTDLTLGIGGTNEITLTGTNLAPSTAEGNSLGSATLEWEQLFVGDDNGIAFGLDQDWTLAFDQATDNRLELVTSGTTGALIQSAATTGTALNVFDNAIPTETVLQVSSTATSLTTAGDGFLGYFNWAPGSATTASGDLFRINIGTNGNVTNVFNVTDNGSSLFRVSETQIESALPHSFTAAGDVNIAYDLVFTNQTSSNINSYGPLTITAGESFESNNLTLQVYNSGQVVVASASGQLKMNVEGWIETNLNHSTSSTEAVCGTSTAEEPANAILDDCTTSVNADYAEMYPTETDVDYGDIVVLGPNKIEAEHKAVDQNGNIISLGTRLISKLIKSSAPYQESVIGIVSNNWSDFSSTGASSVPANENPKPVALSGRVPVKVSENSQAISVGDYITTSSDPGKAMKATSAGQVIGKALESWDPSINQETVMVFVNNMYYAPAPENALTREEIEAMLRQAKEDQALLNQSNEWEELIVSDLYVTNTATLNSLSLSQSLVLGNDLVIQNNNIDTLTNPLNIQGSGTQPLNFMAGKVTIDTSGNMTITGDLKVLGTIDAGKVTVSDQVAGSAIIPTGYFEITILNENIKPDSLIFVTPTSSVKYAIYVKSQAEGTAVIGFDEPEVPTETDTKFNWWIVGVSQ